MNSLRRFATERAISGSSSGSGSNSGGSSYISADATSPGSTPGSRQPLITPLCSSRKRSSPHSARALLDSFLRLLCVASHLGRDLEVPTELVEVSGRILRVGQDLAQPSIGLAAPPLSRVAHRHLLEPH